MSGAERRLPVLFLLAVTLGCEGELTELVVVVDTDMNVPEELDRVRIDVEGFGAQPLAAADLNDTELPLTLGLVHEGGPLGPINIVAEGLREFDRVVIERRQRVYFVRGSVRMLRMELVREWRRPDLPG